MATKKTGSKGGGGSNTAFKVEDFVFVGPRKNATISFTVKKGAKPVPNARAAFFLGKDALKAKAKLTKGGSGPDASDLWTIPTDLLGMGYKEGINLGGFGYSDYNNITIRIEDPDSGNVVVQTAPMDPEEMASAPTKPVAPKATRTVVSPADEKITTVSEWFSLRLDTKTPDGKSPAPDQERHLDCTELMTVQVKGTGVLLCDKQKSCVIKTNDKAWLRVDIKIYAVDANLTIFDPETGEEIKKHLQYST